MAREKNQRGVTRQAVAGLWEAGLSQADIARALGISRPTVCFHMRSLGHAARTELSRRYPWPEIRAYYEAGHSAKACQERFGFGRNAWADAIARGDIEPRPRAEPLENLLRSGRPAHRDNLKIRLLRDGLKVACCEECGLTEWLGRPIGLQLHHVNGERDDNRIANLKLLCPNCHSQTDTWGARKRRLTKPENSDEDAAA